MSEAAIIVGACGHLDEFVRTDIEAILAHCQDPFYLILIDDNSPDETGEFFDQVVLRHIDTRVIHHPDRHGTSYTRNLGIRLATEKAADPIIILDADTKVGVGWLEQAKAGLLRHPEAWIIGYAGFNVGPAPNYHGACQLDAPSGESCRRELPVDYCAGSLLVMRPDIITLMGYGPFDPIFASWASEDFDLGLRIWLKGGECWQLPINATHLGGGRTIKDLPMSSYVYHPPAEPFIPEPVMAKWRSDYWANQWTYSRAERRCAELGLTPHAGVLG